MIKLSEKSGSMTFYFKSMKDCMAFLYVFNDHMCNVPWKSPEIVSDDTMISTESRKALDCDPKERAERFLSWGFELTKRLNIGLTVAQNAYINKVLREHNES